MHRATDSAGWSQQSALEWMQGREARGVLVRSNPHPPPTWGLSAALGLPLLATFFGLCSAEAARGLLLLTGALLPILTTL